MHVNTPDFRYLGLVSIVYLKVEFLKKWDYDTTLNMADERKDPTAEEELLRTHAATLWRNPGQLIRVHKEILRARGESMVEKLGECPLTIKIRIPFLITDSDSDVSQARDGEKIVGYIERESLFTMFVYGDKTTGEEHVALMKGIGDGEDVPVRVHSSCLTAESFHATNCECHEQLEMALSIADREGIGGVVWLHQEGRGNGLAAKAKQLQIMYDEQVDTIEAFERAGYPSDQRDYSIAADILRDLGIKSVRLITNNPSKIQQLTEMGIAITDRIPCEIPAGNDVVRKDLDAKRDKLGHMLS